MPKKCDVIDKMRNKISCFGKSDTEQLLLAAMSEVMFVAKNLPTDLGDRPFESVVAIIRESVTGVFAAREADVNSVDPKVRARIMEYSSEDFMIPVSLSAMANTINRVDGACAAFVQSVPDETALIMAQKIFMPKLIRTGGRNDALNAYNLHLKELAEKNSDYDPMTGLPKFHSIKPIFLDYIEKKQPFVYLNMDFNLLKVYNSSFGHDFVDKLLRLSAVILTENLRRDDLPFRRSTTGDEFGAGARVPNFDHAVMVGAKIFRALGAVSRLLIMDGVDFQVLNANRSALLKKMLEKGLNEVEEKALQLIEDFAQENQLDLTDENTGEASWDNLPTAQRVLDQEKHGRKVCPSFGWTIGLAFCDPRAGIFMGKKADEILQILEGTSEIGVSKLKIDRPGDRFSIIDERGGLHFFDREMNEIKS